MIVTTCNVPQTTSFKTFGNSKSTKVKLIKKKYNQLQAKKRRIINNKNLPEKEKEILLAQVNKKMKLLSTQLKHAQKTEEKNKLESERIKNKTEQEINEQAQQMKQLINQALQSDLEDCKKTEAVIKSMAEDCQATAYTAKENVAVTDTETSERDDNTPQTDDNTDELLDKGDNSGKTKISKNPGIIKYYRKGLVVDEKM